MPTIESVIERIANAVAAPFGYELRKTVLGEKAEGFPGYLAEAQRADMDVNDWIEQRLGWKPAQPILEETTYPYLRDDSVVCELGVGTGRWSRHLATRVPRGELHLVDHSPWLYRFLTDYFRANPVVRVHLNDDNSLPFSQASWIDVIFSDGTFLEFKLGIAHLFAREFMRVLKPGGYAVFDYLDPTTSEGWAHLVANAERLGYVYTYHAPEAMDRVFTAAGFEIVKRFQAGKSTYLTVKKPEALPVGS